MSTAELFQKLDSVPRMTATHHWADYMELLCLINLDGEVAPDDLIERWKGHDDLDLPEVQEEDEDGPLDAPMIELGESVPQADDRRRRKADDVFNHLVYRAATFEDDYPFEVEDDGVNYLRRRTELTSRQRIYVFLLLASLLIYIPTKRRHQLTQPFERLAAEVLRRWLPGDSEVHVFGTASEGSDRYMGTLWEKINKLAADIRESVLLDKGAFSQGDTGDLGLDVVAWLPLGDDEPGLPVFFVQATCQLNWKGKQHESGESWTSYLRQSAPRGNLLFVPFCFRSPTGQWFDPKWPTQAVLMDRQRLLWVMDSDSWETLPDDFLTEVIAYREAV